MNRMTFAALSTVAIVNPRLDLSNASTTELVDFLPMAGVDARYSSVTAESSRPLYEVQKGFTAFTDEDVLVAKITPCFENGKISQVRTKNRFGFGSTEFHVIRAHKEKLDPRYLVNLLRCERILIEGERKMTGSAGQRRVPKHFLETLELPIPSLTNQKRIAAILDQADALRTTQRETLAQLDSLAQAIFVEMFGDPTNSVKKWEEKTIGEVASGKYGVKAGPFGSSLKKEDYSNGGYRVYGQEQVIAGRFDIGNYYISEKKFKELQSCAVAEGDLLVSLVGTFGKVLIVPIGIEPGIINPRLLKITPNTEIIEPEYLANFIGLQSTQATFGKLAHGGTMGILNAGILKQVKIIIPPLSLQKKFINRVQSVKLAQVASNSLLAELNTLFTSLQHRAFRGEL